MGVYGAFLKNGFLTQMAHRGQYAMRMLAKIMGWSTGMIMVLILLERFGQIGGWKREEILLLYAFDILSYSVAATFFMGSFGKLHRLIRQGELDLVLTKPADPMIYLAASHVSAGYTSNYLMGCACDLPDPAGYCPDARSSVLAGSGSFGSIFDTGGGLCIYSGSCLLDWGERGLVSPSL